MICNAAVFVNTLVYNSTIWHCQWSLAVREIQQFVEFTNHSKTNLLTRTVTHTYHFPMVVVILALILHHGRWSTVHNESTTRQVGGISAAIMYRPSVMNSCTAWLQWKCLSFFLRANNTALYYKLGKKDVL